MKRYYLWPVLVISVAACSSRAPQPAAAPPAMGPPPSMAAANAGRTSSLFGSNAGPNIASQTQPLTASIADVYKLRFVHDASASLPLLSQDHRLSISREGGELVVDLSNAKASFTGTADPIDAARWSVGLAGFESRDGEPMIMHLNVEKAALDGGALSGSVVVAAEGKNYTAAFVAVKDVAPVPAAQSGTAPTDSHFHLPTE